jgi:hypothetical protein
LALLSRLLQECVQIGDDLVLQSLRRGRSIVAGDLPLHGTHQRLDPPQAGAGRRGAEILTVNLAQASGPCPYAGVPIGLFSTYLRSLPFDLDWQIIKVPKQLIIE